MKKNFVWPYRRIPALFHTSRRWAEDLVLQCVVSIGRYTQFSSLSVKEYDSLPIKQSLIDPL